ncbi:MAG TPA: SRPBCC family protein [Acidimicrobiales bacterium]
MHLSESVDLDVPSGYAFDFLADPGTARIIDPAVREYRPDSIPMREGTRTDIRFRMWLLPVRAVSVVRDWEPGGRMVMESERPAWPVRVVATHRFEPAGPDRCPYTWAIGLVPVGALGPLAARLFARFMQANAKAQQERFKAEVERRWRAAPGSAAGSA